ncbi:MAG: hypothetical protein GX446_05590 [Chthonomonadales bacterium]|nr:hypothetical protein [Chthonomonadales bacterium]
MLALMPLMAMLVATAASSGPSRVLDVRAFGARPNDGKDDTAAVARAIEEIGKLKGGRLVFPKGRYEFHAGSNPASPGAMMALDGLDAIEIDGGGSEFRFHGLAQGLTFHRCTNITLRNVTLEWAPAPFSVGRVIAATERSFDVEVEPEYPVKGGEPVGAFMEYDPATRTPLRRGLDVYNGVELTELIRPQVLRLRLKWPIAVKPGVLVVLRHQVYGYNGVSFHRCSNVRTRNVTMHSVPGMGLIAVHSRDVTIEGLRVIPRPGTRHPMSATADATHFMGCKGTVTLRNCVFEGMGDDGANVKSGLYLTVQKRLDERTVLAQHNLKMADLPDPGDVMETFHTDDLIAYGHATVRSAVLEDDRITHRVEFAEPLPAELREGDVLGNASRTPKLRMSNCTVRLNRARGVLCQTRDAIIEGCTFDRCTGPGVLVLTEVVHFFESIGTRDVIVRNSRFIDCNYGAASGDASLMAMAWLKDFAYPPKPGVHRNTVLRNNTIEGADGGGILAAGVEGLTIEGNTLRNVCRNPGRDEAAYGVRIINCGNVRLQGNHVPEDRQGAGFKKDVRMTP